jgi:hypothetical protein
MAAFSGHFPLVTPTGPDMTFAKMLASLRKGAPRAAFEVDDNYGFLLHWTEASEVLSECISDASFLYCCLHLQPHQAAQIP